MLNEEAVPPASCDAPESLRWVRLLDHQRELASALAEKDKRLSDMYIGCIAVLGTPGLPDALPLAAHGARELMRFVPQVLDLPWKAHGERLGDRVDALHAKWTAVVTGSLCKKGSAWAGLIDAPLKKFLAGLDEFFVWREAHSPRRKTETMALLTGLEASEALPQQIQEANAIAWEDLVTFFNGVAHHGVVPERSELDRHLDRMEELLLVRLRPRTFDDFAELDALIATAGS